jgi:hypothetical protein
VSCSGRWTPAVQALSTADRRAMHALRQRCTEIQLYDPRLQTELFDKACEIDSFERRGDLGSYQADRSHYFSKSEEGSD